MRKDVTAFGIPTFEIKAPLQRVQRACHDKHVALVDKEAQTTQWRCSSISFKKLWRSEVTQLRLIPSPCFRPFLAAFRPRRYHGIYHSKTLATI
jgi:hypothetical protein